MPQGRREKHCMDFYHCALNFLGMCTFGKDLSVFQPSLSKQDLRNRRIQLEWA